MAKARKKAKSSELRSLGQRPEGGADRGAKSPRRPSVAAAVVAVGMTAIVALGVQQLVRGGALGGNRSAVPNLVSPGMAAPDFALPDQAGRAFRLSDYRGRAVFLAFVPDWNDPDTVAEARSLAATVSQFDAAGAKVMMVGPDGAGEAAKALHDRERLPFPLLTDAGGRLARQYGVPAGEPGRGRMTFVIDPAGTAKFRVGGTTFDAAGHGPQLLKVSKCCIDEVMAARAHGVGNRVGDYSLPRADRAGVMERLLAEDAQKLTLVLFLSVKCPCSNAYNERVRALAGEYRAKGVRVVGVYANQDETAAEIAGHARENRFEFPVLRDERGLCADHLGAQVTPEAFLIDRQHVLRYAGRIDDSREAGEVKTRSLRDAIHALLTGVPFSKADTPAFGCAIVRSELPSATTQTKWTAPQ